MAVATPDPLCPLCGSPLMASHGSLACPTCIYRETATKTWPNDQDLGPDDDPEPEEDESE